MNSAGEGVGQLDLEIPAALAGERVDRVVALLGDLSRKAVAELVAEGGVLLDGDPVRAGSRKVAEGQRLHATLAPPRPFLLVADPEVVFSVLDADDDLIVVDKPAGLVVHRGPGHDGSTLVEGLLARFPELAELAEAGIGDPGRPGIVHRLDRQTSGLLVVARSERGFRSLGGQFRSHSVTRRYRALVHGTVGPDRGVIDAPIGRSTREPTRMALRAAGRPARTRYVVAERFRAPQAMSLVEAELETGRTHQVRVHFAALGHPVVGDERYGAGAPPALRELLSGGRFFLHAAHLEVDDPGDGARRVWDAALPPDLVAVLARLEVAEP